ncbi:MAG: DUF4339 domain-containing protein [Chthoniobacterales bacterium]|nr:DUF4339 domain-containing protein [Chthoniobacterales bacterium]
MIYHVARDGEVLGEFSEDEFRARRARGAVLPTDHYWTEEMSEWKPVSEYRVVAKTQRIRIAPELAPPTPIVIAVSAQPEKPVQQWYRSLPLAGGALILLAIALSFAAGPLFYASLFLLAAALVIAILSVVRGGLIGGIVLLLSLIVATVGIVLYR